MSDPTEHLSTDDRVCWCPCCGLVIDARQNGKKLRDGSETCRGQMIVGTVAEFRKATVPANEAHPENQ